MSKLLGNKKIIRAWTLFDWSNSVYQLSITSAILPAYFIAVAKGDSNGLITFFGYEVINTSLYAWAVSASFLFVALFSPLLSSIADYTGRRKLFMQLFTWIGALSCSMLFFFDKTHLELGIIAFTLAGIGYSGGLVFYNAWLPEIAPPGQEDRISARGYALGYTGGIVLLVINLAMILKPDFFGITQDGMAARISFVTVGIWWLGFSQITFYYLPTYTISRRSMRNPVLNGYRELLKVWSEFKTQRQLKIYLAAFFFIMMAVLTVMYMAANFGKKELNLDDQILIPTVLLIQIIGIMGSIGFARFSEKFGNIPALQLSILIWIGICIAAYFVIDSTGFIVLASFVGLVMGGVQSLARSTYTKLLPQTQDHTAYFSFYDVTEKLAVVFGTFLFGLLESVTGSMRTSILMLGILFVIGFFLLVILNNSKQLPFKEMQKIK
jgi:UMF1 family MFS transporter